MKLALTLLTAVLLAPVTGMYAADTSQPIASEQPQVQANCNGVPIKRFGFCWVLGEAPNLLDDGPLQVGNTAPRVKIHPKDSSRIKRNYLGVTTTRMPRSTENDYLRARPSI
jgi:hypothetical protein